MGNAGCFRRFGTMLDCSRNAVPNVESLKKWISLTADMGCNCLQLYTEDTYEVEGHPYFGYMRGRYSKAELKEIDAYALSKGMELIPCVQTLAHLSSINRWDAFEDHMDTEDILLIGDEAVYEFIDSMFATFAECFTSRVAHIGMDEAHMIGRGKYYDLHGDSDRVQILLEHLQRVSEIGKKYGFTLLIWSDMFFRLASGGNYYNPGANLDTRIREEIPDNVELVYWDYCIREESHFAAMLDAHNRMADNTWFAGGLQRWAGFAPYNGYSIAAAKPAVEGCRNNGVRDVIMTMWGDNGGECSSFAVLPSLFYAARVAAGETDDGVIAAQFEEKFGIPFEKFMYLDLPGTPNAHFKDVVHPEKYLLYNDCFTGMADCNLTGAEGTEYAACAEALSEMAEDPEWGYLFATQKALCSVLAVKANLGQRTRQAYLAKDRAAVASLTGEYGQLEERLEVFYEAFRTQWYKENKAFGFEVQDIRLGGLIRRVEDCRRRLEAWSRGELARIEELEEQQLKYTARRDWNHLVSASRL